MTLPIGSQSAASHEYRPDIDGLRAIAVLSVLLFHLDLGAFAGGFVGVDIFFVISGYLITKLIYDDLQRDRFSLADFYVRRVRRIFPALYLTIALTLVAAAVIFEHHEMQPLMGALGYVSVFLSNIYFMRGGGYFDAPLGTNPVLQTWSLSVEEQFYLGFPLFLILAHQFARPYLRGIIFAVGVLSLAAGAVRVNIAPQSAFFATELRIFELMIGALCAYLPRQQGQPGTRNAVALLGLALVFGSILFLSPSVPFPGPTALPVCLGTAAIIWAGHRDGATVVNRMLAWRPLVGVGLISYSVYLLHWPLIVFTKRVALTELTLSHKAALAFVALAGGYLSWRFVETPFRIRAVASQPRQAIATAVALIGVLGIGSIVAENTLLKSPTDLAWMVERNVAAAEPCLLNQSKTPDLWRAEHCIIGNKGPIIAVWGDSYAGHYFNSFRDHAEKSGARLALFGSGSCPPAIGLELKEWPHCRRFNDLVLRELGTMKPDVVVLSAHWLNYEKRRSMLGNDVIQHVRETVVRLRSIGAEVLVLGPSPIFPNRVPVIAAARSGLARSGFFHARFSRMFDSFFHQLHAQGLIRYVPTFTLFCDGNELCRFRDQDSYLFYDEGHMTREGADRVVDRLAGRLFYTGAAN